MRTASTLLRANDFTAENITFANSTPRDVAQALALAANGDRQTFRRCRFLGWQDTLYLGDGRKYFEDCHVEGGVDFIFGPGTALFKNCEIHSKRHGYVTAASTPKDAPFGFVFVGCKLTAADDVKAGSVYLGRPWRDFGAATYLDCAMAAHVRPEGWHNWNQPAREKTARYAEHNSNGDGAAPKTRVSWSKQLTDEEAKAITVAAVLGGKDGWDPISSKEGKK
jgi:pectinesterase